jgi:hypothetical protein
MNFSECGDVLFPIEVAGRKAGSAAVRAGPGGGLALPGFDYRAERYVVSDRCRVLVPAGAGDLNP